MAKSIGHKLGKILDNLTSESSSSSSSSSSHKEDFVQECINSHNSYRKYHGVSPLKLNNEMCKYAKEWAVNIAKNDKMEHRLPNKYGENIYCSFSGAKKFKLKGHEPVDSWYAEVEDFAFGIEPADSRSGHFTQVIWMDSTEIGIAKAKSKSGRTYVIVNYNPQGNISGKFGEKVPPVGGFQKLSSAFRFGSRSTKDSIFSSSLSSEDNFVLDDLKANNSRKTVWSHEYKGDTEIAEICFYSVESSCQYEKSGCRRLHAARHFHWQVSEQQLNWLNLPFEQVLALEKAYCDREHSVALPRLDPASLPVGAIGLLLFMTRDVWTVDYRSMAMANSNQNRLLYLRRMATEAIHGVTLLGDGYHWYFEDKNKKWIKYGEPDSAGETQLVVGVTSDDLEHAYRQNPTGSLAFTNAKFKYTLDFQAMMQINMQTQVRRPVIRRPRPHLKESKKGEEKQDDLALPKDWDPMQTGERLRTITLATFSPEYQQVIALINGQIATQNIVKIERVQNPFLWRALQNKIQELMTLYKQDTSKVNVCQLFHGTRADVVKAICLENFDWRLHGSSVGQLYGRGTYFAPAASTSYDYCTAGTKGLKCMFVALVAVGSMVIGNASMVRPPQNPVTGMPYESSGNGTASSASIIVKYDKQEYYPQYVITLT